jgi:hypothetical protein
MIRYEVWVRDEPDWVCQAEHANRAEAVAESMRLNLAGRFAMVREVWDESLTGRYDGLSS